MDQSLPRRCLVDLDSGHVLRCGELERLAPKPLMLLRYFVERRGAVVGRDELIGAVWGHLEAASDDAVNVAISSLRRALGDSDRPFRIIETIPRRGYRYSGVDVDLGPISTTAPSSSTAASAALTSTSSPSAVRSSEVSATTDQDQRSATTDETPAVGGAEDEPHHHAHLSHGDGRVRRLWLLAASAVLLLLCGAWLLTPAKAPFDSADQGRSIDGMPARPSVAVLPFLDLSADAEHGYFADALVDRIIHMLAQAEGLQVAARTSSFAFRDSQAQVEEIGLKLRVDAVLEGSILREGAQMRVLAQLIDVDSGKHLWSRSYDRAVDDLFEVQDDIANEVSQTMTDTLLSGDVLRAPGKLEAYDRVVRARRAADSNTLEGLKAAIGLLDQALTIDPDYVPALVARFEIGGQLHGVRGGSEREEMQRAFAALERARLLAPNNSEVLRAQGSEYRRLGQHEQALASYRKALLLNPSDSIAHSRLGDLLLYLGRNDEALEVLRMAERIDPLSERIATRLADAYWSVGRAEEAIAKLRLNIREHPHNPANHDRLANYLNQMGRTGAAMRHIIAQRELDPASPRRQFRVCEFHLQLGDDAAAEACTNEFEQADAPRFQLLYLRQAVHSFRGEWAQQNALMDELLLLSNRNDPVTPALVAMSHARYSCDRALQILRDHSAELFAEPPTVAPGQTLAARVLVYCLQRSGAHAQAVALLSAYAQAIERMRVQQGPWSVAGDEHAALLALSGEDDAAVDELRRLVDAGWRYYWWQLDQRLEYRHLADRADFISMHQKLREGVARELAYFRAHQDQPL